MTTFQGVRPALFNFNTSGQPGGYADFDNYTVDEPRARGIEREIPMGKTIMLTSGADGSLSVRRYAEQHVGQRSAAIPQAQNASIPSRGCRLGPGGAEGSNGRFVSAAEDGVT